VSESRALLLAAVLVAAIAPGVYLLAGGDSYRPRPVESPCAGSAWRSSSIGGLLEETALSTIDGAACRLGVNQADLALALSSRARLDAFAAQHHLSEAQIDAAARAGLIQAVHDGQRAGKLNGFEAAAIEFAARSLPVDRLIQFARTVLGQAGY
jgi:hypothetical protein